MMLNLGGDTYPGIYHHLRGFATNVGKHQPLGEPCSRAYFPNLEKHCDATSVDPCCIDPCGTFKRGGVANNEHNFVQLLFAYVTELVPDWYPRFIIDTSRNGNSDAIRESCENWCNVRGAGLGRAPTRDVRLPYLLDAYFWLKTPGESDGCTEYLPDGSRCPRFDAMCASVDSIGSAIAEPRAPTAGEWFIPKLAELACFGAKQHSNLSLTV